MASNLEYSDDKEKGVPTAVRELDGDSTTSITALVSEGEGDCLVDIQSHD